MTIAHTAVERRGQIPTGGFSGSGTSPGSRERETDCDVREERPQAKTAIVKDSAQPVVAPEAGTTKRGRWNRAVATRPMVCSALGGEPKGDRENPESNGLSYRRNTVV